MHAIRLDDLRIDAQPPFSLSGCDGQDQSNTTPIIRVRRTVHRHRTDFSWIPMTLFALITFAVVYVFALDLVDRTTPRQVKPKTAKPAIVNTPVSEPTSNEAGDQTKPPIITKHKDTANSDWVDGALQACREGRLDDAKALAEAAMRKRSGTSQGQVISLLVSYLKQYESLSQQAIFHMNGAVEVDLGPMYGLGAFVESSDGFLVFHCRGRSVRLTLDELRALDGVQYRLTRQFLSNGGMPANNLILAAVHFVHGIDGEGKSDPDGRRAREAARSCLMLASSGPDNAVAEQAKLFLKLIDG